MGDLGVSGMKYGLPGGVIRHQTEGRWSPGLGAAFDVNGFVNETVRNGADWFDTV